MNWIQSITQGTLVSPFFQTYYYIVDKISGTTTKLDGTVIDAKSGQALYNPLDLDGKVVESSKQKLTWRFIVLALVLVIGLFAIIKLLTTLGIRVPAKKRR